MILNQLRSRQIAVEQIETYGRQQMAAGKERELREAQARAEQQRNITESELSITVQSNQGKAEYARALQQAAQIRALAEAEAEKTARVGIGQAIAIEEQVAAYGGPQFQVTQQVMNRFAEAVQQSRVDVVPRVVIGGAGGTATSSGVMEGLLTLLLSDKLGLEVSDARAARTEPASGPVAGSDPRGAQGEPAGHTRADAARPGTGWSVGGEAGLARLPPRGKAQTRKSQFGLYCDEVVGTKIQAVRATRCGGVSEEPAPPSAIKGYLWITMLPTVIACGLAPSMSSERPRTLSYATPAASQILIRNLSTSPPPLIWPSVAVSRKL